MMVSVDTPFDFLTKIFSLFFLPLYLFLGNFSNNNLSELEFKEYVYKFYNAAQAYDISISISGGETKECYSVDKIGLSDVKDYKGYVCIHREDNDDVNIYVSLSNNKYSTFTKVGNKTYNYINFTSGEIISLPDSEYIDYKAYVGYVDDNYSNKLEVKNGKPVNPYEI